MHRGRMFALVMISCVVPSLSTAEEGKMENREEVQVPQITVVGSPIARQGTGTLHLDQSSPSASRLGLSIREIPASVDIVDQTLLQERGLRTISEAVEGATGVTVGDSPGNPANFSLRGFTNNQIRLLYDGLMIGPASMISRPRDTWNLERIEILKGPASVLYGEGALGGAINFVTKRPMRRDQVTVDALLSYGTFNTLRAGQWGAPALGQPALPRRSQLSDRRQLQWHPTDPVHLLEHDQCPAL